jgi:subtilisin-like proprotein convertase family protein
MKRLKITFTILLMIISIKFTTSQDNIPQVPVTGDSYGSGSNNGILGNLGGAGRYGAIPHNNILNPAITGSVEAWIYLTAYNESTSCIVQKGSTFFFGVGSNGINHKLFINTNGTVFSSNDAVPLNRWVHVAVSWLQGSPNSLVTFTIDGISNGAQSLASTWSNNSDSLTIGGSRLIPGAFINGFVDEVRLWNSTRSASEIARTRFIGVGDGPAANQSAAVTSNEDYKYLLASWTFNLGGLVYEDINNLVGVFRGGTAVQFTNVPGQPVPYNLAMYFPGNINSHIRVPNNSAFNLTGGGTIEAWVYCNLPGGYTVISKGTTQANTTFRLYIQGSGLVSMQLGNSSVSAGLVQFQKWNHVAVSWTGAGGGNYSVKFYINGKFINQQLLATSIPITNDPLRIGNLQWDANNNFNGYMDELRIWSREMTQIEIRANMFNSTRSQTLIGPLVASWDFEGNLNNISTTAGINGTFNTGAANTCRFSGYLNETTTGPISDIFDGHPTTINRKENPSNPFPGGFSLRVPDLTIPAGTTVYDTIYIPGNVSINDVEVFLSVQQPSVSGIIAKLKAPNGQERSLVSINGGQGNGILTFFKDGTTPLSAFNAPWSYLAAPYQAFNLFGLSSPQGNWVLSVQNTAGQPEGKLLGWGLRINNSVTGVQPVSGSIPEEFSLRQNYPNPFNPATTIEFSIPRESNAKLRVFDLLGKEVKSLVNEDLNAGVYKIELDASSLASGTYFYKLETDGFVDVKKMILVK